MNAMNEGVVFAQQERYNEAEQKLEEAATLDGTNHQAIYNLALVQMKQQRFDEAKDSLLRAIAIEGKVAGYHEQLGTAHMELEAWEDAKKALETAVEQQPKLSRAYYKLGQCERKLENGQQALHHFTKSIENNPRFVEAYVQLANTYIDEGYLDHALQVLASGQKVVEQGSDLEAQLHQLTGTAHQQKKDYVTAIEDYKRALAISPGMHEALFSIGWTYASQGNKVEAKKFLSQFVQVAGAEMPEYYMKAARDRLAMLESE